MSEGVWVVYAWDWHPLVEAVFPEELAARRWADDQGSWYEVAFLPFGGEVSWRKIAAANRG